MSECKGCITYISGVCALAITDPDCPCFTCLVKVMCKTICDDQLDLLMKEQALRLKD